MQERTAIAAQVRTAHGGPAGTVRLMPPWACFGLVYLLGTIATAALGMTAPFVGEVAASFHVSVAAVGAALVCLYLPGVVLGAEIGAAVDWLGAKRLMLLSAVLMVLGDLLQVVCSRLVWFAGDLLVQGIAVSSMMSAGQVLVAREFSGATQARALTAWSTVNFVGYATGLLLASVFAAGPGWRATYLFHTALAVACACAALTLPHFGGAAFNRGSRPRLGGLRRESNAIRISIALGLAGIAGVGTNACVSFYWHTAHHVALSLTASSVALGNVLCIPGGLLLGWLLSKGILPIGLMRGITAVSVVSGVVTYLPSIPLAAAIAALYTYQACLSGITALTYAVIPQSLTDRGQLAPATGMLLQIGSIGAMAGPTLFFAVVGNEGWKAIVAVLVALWAAALWTFPRFLSPGRTASAT